MSTILFVLSPFVNPLNTVPVLQCCTIIYLFLMLTKLKKKILNQILAVRYIILMKTKRVAYTLQCHQFHQKHKISLIRKLMVAAYCTFFIKLIYNL